MILAISLYSPTNLDLQPLSPDICPTNPLPYPFMTIPGYSFTIFNSRNAFSLTWLGACKEGTHDGAVSHRAAAKRAISTTKTCSDASDSACEAMVLVCILLLLKKEPARMVAWVSVDRLWLSGYGRPVVERDTLGHAYSAILCIWV